MTDIPDHFCPGCGEAQKAFPRYAWYFCQGCLALACDRDGRGLEFGNVSFSGGLYYKYSDSQERHTISSVACLINRRPVLVTEARFGGVVAQPLTEQHLNRIIKDNKITDLRSRHQGGHGS